MSIAIPTNAAKTKIRNLPLDKIRIDGGTQARFGLRPAVVQDYVLRLDRLPPGDVFFDGADYWLADGFHRYDAHRKSGKPTMAVVVHKGTQRDAILFAVGANAEHGMQRSDDDKAKAVEILLTDAEWSK